MLKLSSTLTSFHLPLLPIIFIVIYFPSIFFLSVLANLFGVLRKVGCLNPFVCQLTLTSITMLCFVMARLDYLKRCFVTFRSPTVRFATSLFAIFRSAASHFDTFRSLILRLALHWFMIFCAFVCQFATLNCYALYRCCPHSYALYR